MIQQTAKKNEMKIFYFHVPKTAGSSINAFFANNTNKYRFHIEGIKDWNDEFINEYDFVSGHVSFDRMNKMLQLKEWITFVTFREPLAYTISHIKWVRKLADPGEEERLRNHPPIFQKIALKMLDYNFSKPSEIKNFISWLESINFYYFHNTQIHYMNVTGQQNNLTDTQIQKAINNMKKIDFVGIQEKLDDFMEMISYEFGWELDQKPRANVNENNYGFEINDPETQKALLPLYEKDLILYEEAKKLYVKQKSLYDNKRTEDIIGYVDSITPTEIVGWCRSENSLRKVELELKVDGKVIQTTTANIYRQGLKTKGIHPSGLCAFQFVLENELDRDKISINVANTNHALPFSKKL